MSSKIIYPRPTPGRRKEILHIYRHILREISYLPPAFSSSISSIVRDRFHSCRKPSPHDNARISRAKRNLRNLQLANNGDADKMMKFMDTGFGRIGRRRYELFEKLRSAQAAEDSDALEALTGGSSRVYQRDLEPKKEKAMRRGDLPWPNQKPKSALEIAIRAERKEDLKSKAAPDPENKNLKYKFLDSWDRVKLENFARSQQQQQTAVAKSSAKWGPTIRHTHETFYVPEETSWGKLPKQAQVRSKVAAFWKMTADKILPPVEKGEFDLLEKLRSGAQEKGEWKLPRKRTPARSSHRFRETTHWSWEDHATMKTQHLEPSRSVKPTKRLTGQTSPFTGDAPRNSLSERWFRRQYQSLLFKTSYTVKNPNTLKDQYVWGTPPGYKAKPAPHQMALFEPPEKKRGPLVFLYISSRRSPLCSRF